jgi:hypothetical protein
LVDLSTETVSFAIDALELVVLELVAPGGDPLGVAPPLPVSDAVPAPLMVGLVGAVYVLSAGAVASLVAGVTLGAFLFLFASPKASAEPLENATRVVSMKAGAILRIGPPGKDR